MAIHALITHTFSYVILVFYPRAVHPLATLASFCARKILTNAAQSSTELKSLSDSGPALVFVLHVNCILRAF